MSAQLFTAPGMCIVDNHYSWCAKYNLAYAHLFDESIIIQDVELVAAANMAFLRVVPESELQQGKVIGTGSFGKVFKVGGLFNYDLLW